MKNCNCALLLLIFYFCLTWDFTLSWSKDDKLVRDHLDAYDGYQETINRGGRAAMLRVYSRDGITELEHPLPVSAAKQSPDPNIVKLTRNKGGNMPGIVMLEADHRLLSTSNKGPELKIMGDHMKNGEHVKAFEVFLDMYKNTKSSTGESMLQKYGEGVTDHLEYSARHGLLKPQEKDNLLTKYNNEISLSKSPITGPAKDLLNQKNLNPNNGNTGTSSHVSSSEAIKTHSSKSDSTQTASSKRKSQLLNILAASNSKPKNNFHTQANLPGGSINPRNLIASNSHLSGTSSHLNLNLPSNFGSNANGLNQKNTMTIVRADSNVSPLSGRKPLPNLDTVIKSVFKKGPKG